MNSKIIYCFLLFLFLASCKKEEDDSGIFDFGQEAEFRMFQEYSSNDKNLQFTIFEINDSRCPNGAMCVWAGEVEVKIAIEKPALDTLILTSPDELTGNSGVYTFELCTVAPYPDIVSEIEPEDYIVLMKITRYY
ncbi:hypothetical protein OU798_12875 [Prolixibacteraceae bacterium Z1-6]|uniref:Lipoprotein n=1 Tax=Draconibacterium aestuarii TaxID=2998507 RepID=A0A9X3J578_9BACT|nr:hypothetical protein [Prolixibacteraceae bacterium Z1-6]